MESERLSWARRGCQFKSTTITDENQHRPSDLVDRQFVASAPNRLWVADLTYVKTHTGWTDVDFIIDVFSRMIAGLLASTSLRSDLAIDALEMAIYARYGRDLSALIHHSDSQNVRASCPGCLDPHTDRRVRMSGDQLPRVA